MPNVSVLIPAHNAERYIDSCIRSVLNQTWTDFELIIFDDGSIDNTSQIIAKYAMADQRIVHQRSTNQGMARTLNAMIEIAQGEFIARLDADDEALPERLQKQVEFLTKHQDYSLVGTAVINIDEDGDPYNVEFFPAQHTEIEQRLLNGNGGIMHPSTMIRKHAIVQAGGYALNFPVVEDQDLWLRIALQGKLANLEVPLTRYRVHAQNMSFTGGEAACERLAEILLIAHQQRGLEPPSENPNPAYACVDAEVRYRHWAWSAIHAGNYKTARKHARRLLAKNSWNLDTWKLFCFAYFPRFASRTHQFLKSGRGYNRKP